MACQYRIPGTNTWMSEAEFKKQLNAGLLDKAMIEEKISISGIKPSRQIAKGYIEPDEVKAVSERKENRSEYIQNRVAKLQSEFNNLSPAKKKGKEGSGIRQEIITLSNEAGYTVNESSGKISVTGESGKRVVAKSVKDEGPEINEDQLNYAKKVIQSGLLRWDGDVNSSRWDSGLDWGTIRRAEKDLIAGKNDTPAVRKVVAEIDRQKGLGGFNMMVGSGGSKSSYGIPLDAAISEDAFEQIDSETQKIIDEQEAQLAAEYDAWFAKQNKESQIEILEEYEGRIEEQVGEDVNEGKSEENVPDEAKAKPKTESEERTKEVILPPVSSGKPPRVFRFIDGEWKMKSGNDYESVGQTVADQVEKQYKQDEEAWKTKEAEAEKRTADRLIEMLEQAKIQKGSGNIYALPVPPGIWNSMITAIQKFIKAGDTFAVAFEKASKSVLGKAVKDNVLSQSEADSVKSEMKSVLEKNIESDQMKPKARREAKMEIAEKIREISGSLKRSGVSGRDPELVRQMIYDYAKSNLPKGGLKKADVVPLLNQVANASTDNDLQKAFDRVDKIVDKYAEEKRQESASDLISKIKNKRTLLRKVGNVWKGKLSIEAQEKYKDYINSLPLDQIENMTQFEIDSINAEIDSILETGKTDQKAIDIVKDIDRRRVGATTLEAMAGALGMEGKTISGKENMIEYLKEGRKTLIVNGMQVNSKSGLDALENNTGIDLDSVEAKGYEVPAMDVAEANDESKSGITPFKRRYLNVIKNFELVSQWIWGGTTKEFKDVMQKRLVDPVQEAMIDKNQAIFDKIQAINSAKKNIFGSLNKASNRISEEVSGLHNQMDMVLNDQVIAWYSTLMQGPETYGPRLQKSGVNVEKLVEYMNDPKNIDLKKYSEYLVDEFFPSIKSDYESTYILVNNQPLPEGRYFPTSADPVGSETVNVESMFDDGGQALMNAITSHLKERTSTTSELKAAKGADQIIMDYVQNMEHSRFFVPIAVEANKIFNEINRPLIYSKVGKKNYQTMMSYIKELITNENQIKDDTATKKFVNFFASWAALTTLSFKLAQIPKQFVASINLGFQGYKHGLGLGYTYKNMPFLANKEERDALSKMMFSTSNAFNQDRYLGGAIDVETRRIQEMRKRSSFKSVRGIGKKAFAGLQFVGMTPILAGDYLSMITGAPLFLGLYRKAKAEGMSSEDAYNFAYKKFANEVDNTLQTSRADITIQRQKSPFGRMVLMYKSAQTLAGLKVIKALKSLAGPDRKLLTPEEKTQAWFDLMIFNATNGVFAAVASKATMSLLLGAEDMDDDDKRKAYHDWMMDSVQGNLQGYGISGSLADWALNNARGKEHFNNIPSVNYMTEKIPDAFSSMLRGVQGEDLSEKEINNIKRLVGYKNIDNAINDWTEWVNGDKELVDALMSYHDFDQVNEDLTYELLWGESKDDSYSNFQSGFGERKRTERKRVERKRVERTDRRRRAFTE